MISSTLIGWGLKILALVAVLVAAYAFGHSSGYTEGYKKGWDDQQVTINKMVTDANAQRTSQNTAISNLQMSAMKASADVFAAKAQAAITRSTVVTQYKTKYVALSQSCGWSTPTVLTINSLLDAGAPIPSITVTDIVPATGAAK
jgi:hypothetical protein